MRKRTLLVAAAFSFALAAASSAPAHPGHTNCQVFGLGTAGLAQSGIPPGAGPATPGLVEFFHGLDCTPK